MQGCQKDFRKGGAFFGCKRCHWGIQVLQLGGGGRTVLGFIIEPPPLPVERFS